MSYILDALKKMEHEKVRKARPGGMATISGELFREERPRPARGGAWKIIAVAVVTACAAMAATWFYLKPGKAPQKTAQRSPLAAAPAAPAIPAPPAIPPVPAAPTTPALPAPAGPTVPTSPTSQTTPPPAAPVRPAAPAAAAAPVSSAPPAPAARKADNLGREPKKQPAPSEQRPVPATIDPPADIKVSGIAWQEERSARRAVVNGFLMKEGGVVAGARIVEISRDRVRFASPSGEFEASMVASGIPGAAK